VETRNMSTIKIETWLPVFPGFYGTLWAPDSDLSEYVRQQISDGEIPEGFEWWKDKNFDGRAYELAVAKVCAEAIKEFLPDEAGIEAIEFEAVFSPREYNFTNDSIDIGVTVDADNFATWIRAYLAAHDGDWRAYLLRHYKSRDGFISFYNHTPEDWAQATENYSLLVLPEDKGHLNSTRRFFNHFVGALLNFWFYTEFNNPEEKLYYRTCDFVSPAQFLNTPEAT
jgi:hypothetical protein